MTIGWEHPEDTLKGWEGINSADMEWFRDEPIEKFAREAVQNSLDAAIGNSKPVKVKFDLTKTLSLISDLILILSSPDLYFSNSLIFK